MGYSFFNLAKDTLMHINKPLSIMDMWKHAEELGFVEKLGTSGKTPWQTLGARIYMDIKQNPNSEFIQVSKRPAMFFLKNLHYETTDFNDFNKQITSDKVNRIKYNERDLHILLSTFVFSNPHFKCYTRTIFHESSKKSKKGYNKWLHPDMVGIYFPFDDFQGNTLKLLEIIKENPYKIFSFELKTDINFGNLREYFFQAVSNSSWAHEGYLVALNIEDDPTLIDEIRRLNNAFGIGIIKLDLKNIEQSEILLSAKNKEFLDWETINRLIEENKDFSRFIIDLMEDIKIGKVKSNYDRLLREDEYEQYIVSKNIN